eukprot:5746659-Heterocapsa_arctica.AAC.1
MACEEFDRLNPPGKFRKQLVDWVQWKRKFSVTSFVTVRQGEEEYSFQDFTDEKSKSNSDAAHIKAEWQSMLDDPSFERTGDGQRVVIWIPLRKKRMRDLTHAATNEVEESSKQLKNLKDKDKKDLKGFCNRSASSAMNDTFLRKAMGKGSDTEEEKDSVEEDSASEAGSNNDESEKKKRKEKGKQVDLGTALSDAHASHTSALVLLEQDMEKVIELCTESISAFTSIAEEAQDVAMKAYQRTCEVRMKACTAWKAASLEACPALPGAQAQAPAQPASSPAAAGPAAAAAAGDDA